MQKDSPLGSQGVLAAGRGEARLQHLESYGSLELQVTRAIHDREPPFADHSLDVIPTLEEGADEAEGVDETRSGALAHRVRPCEEDSTFSKLVAPNG
jgi:hypothetical protein